MKFLYYMLFVFAPMGLLAMNAQEAVEALKNGNRHFAENKPHLEEIRKELAEGQSPFVTLVSCSDSRVPPEIIFNRGLGELFVVRLAGNVVDKFAMESIEFGIQQLKTPILLVLGHTNCGAVEASINAYKKDPNAHFTGLVGKIVPAVKVALKKEGNYHDLLHAAVEENVRLSARNILGMSPTLNQMHVYNKLVVLKGVYNLETGEVNWLD
jgi:carbonic anhydrase